MAELFHVRTGDTDVIQLPNDLSNVEIDIDSQDIVSVYGTHSGDGRVGETAIRVNVHKGRADNLETFSDVINDETFDYAVFERGMWRGKMRLTVVTLEAEQ